MRKRCCGAADQAGKVVPSSRNDREAVPAFPDLPTLMRCCRFVADNWFAIYAPAGTPKEIVATLNTAIRKALETKAVRALFEQDALISVGGTPEELGAHLKRETDRYAEVIRKGNITAQ